MPSQLTSNTTHEYVVLIQNYDNELWFLSRTNISLAAGKEVLQQPAFVCRLFDCLQNNLKIYACILVKFSENGRNDDVPASGGNLIWWSSEPGSFDHKATYYVTKQRITTAFILALAEVCPLQVLFLHILGLRHRCNIGCAAAQQPDGPKPRHCI